MPCDHRSHRLHAAFFRSIGQGAEPSLLQHPVMGRGRLSNFDSRPRTFFRLFKLSFYFQVEFLNSVQQRDALPHPSCLP